MEDVLGVAVIENLMKVTFYTVTNSKATSDMEKLTATSKFQINTSSLCGHVITDTHTLGVHRPVLQGFL